MKVLGGDVDQELYDTPMTVKVRIIKQSRNVILSLMWDALIGFLVSALTPLLLGRREDENEVSINPQYR